MVRYRRNRLQGASYFFTATLADRTSDALVRHMDALREAFRTTLAERPFRVDAMVVMPEHLHAVWTLPVDDDDYPARWHRIKASFSRRVGHRPWQPRYWEHTLRDDQDLARHIDYIHFNPVKHRHVTRAGEWAYSTFHRDVAAGVYPPDWGLAAELDMAAGERRDA